MEAVPAWASCLKQLLQLLLTKLTVYTSGKCIEVEVGPIQHWWHDWFITTIGVMISGQYTLAFVLLYHLEFQWLHSQPQSLTSFGPVSSSHSTWGIVNKARSAPRSLKMTLPMFWMTWQRMLGRPNDWLFTVTLLTCANLYAHFHLSLGTKSTWIPTGKLLPSVWDVPL